MEKNKKDTRRRFLKNTSLSLFSVAVFPTMIKAENSAESLSKKESNSNCNQSTEDAYGQGPFYTANAPNIINNQYDTTALKIVSDIISEYLKTIN